jgi:isopenicillin N synthase-like dioxygenase
MTTASTQSAGVRDIPVVDFAEFADERPAVRAATAAAVRRAFEEVGFLYLRNHGVASGVLDAVFAQSRWFFALPDEAKAAVKWESAASNRGYIPPVGQRLDEDKPTDLKEMYHAGYDDRPPANRWPADGPAFREAVLAFHAAADRTCAGLMQAIALSLGLAEDYFPPYFDRHRGSTRLLHYPPLSGVPLPGQIRAGAHTDFGVLSLLFQDDAGGLEIRYPDGTWTPAPTLPGCAIVNSGDLLERWTNGTFHSAPHRVVNPVGAAAARARYSVVLFYSANPDAVIECLPPCQGPDRPAQYPPITAAEHVLARVKATYTGAA